MSTDDNPTTLQDQFAERLAELLNNATRLMPAVEVFEAALGAAAGFAIQHAPGPAVAETLRHLAAELQSSRRRGDVVQ